MIKLSNIELANIGPGSQSKVYPIHQILHDTFVETIRRGEVKQGKLKAVTSKGIYNSRMDDLLTPPKVESKFPLVNLKKLVYPRVNHAFLEARHRDVMFTIIHGLYRKRERLYKQNRAEDTLSQNQACKNANLAQSIEHIFC